MTRDKALKLLRLTSSFSLPELDNALKSRLANIHPDFQKDLKAAYALLEQEVKQASRASAGLAPDPIYQRPLPPRTVPIGTEAKSAIFQHKGVIVAIIFLMMFAGYFLSGTKFSIRTPPKPPPPKEAPSPPKKETKSSEPEKQKFDTSMLPPASPPRPKYMGPAIYYEDLNIQEVKRTSEMYTLETKPGQKRWGEWFTHMKYSHHEYDTKYDEIEEKAPIEVRTIYLTIKNHAYLDVYDSFERRSEDFYNTALDHLAKEACPKLIRELRNNQEVETIDIHWQFVDKYGKKKMEMGHLSWYCSRLG